MDIYTVPHFICSMKEQLFGRQPSFSESRPCFIFSINFGFDDFGYAEDGNTKLYPEVGDRRSLVFVFAGSSTVWAMEVKDQAFFFPKLDLNPKNKDRDLSKLVFQSDHESGWRDAVKDFYLKSAYEMIDNVTQHRKKAGETIRYSDHQHYIWDTKIASGVLTSKRNTDGYSSVVTDLTVFDKLQVGV